MAPRKSTGAVLFPKTEPRSDTAVKNGRAYIAMSHSLQDADRREDDDAAELPRPSAFSHRTEKPFATALSDRWHCEFPVLSLWKR